MVRTVDQREDGVDRKIRTIHGEASEERLTEEREETLFYLRKRSELNLNSKS